jgi:hypothetical protein
MAATGFTPIKLYSSSTAAAVPLAANLAAGELAINTADGKLFYKDTPGGVVQVIASKAGNVNVASFSAGTTGFTPSTASTGAVTLAGTLALANGGTAATSAPAAMASLTGFTTTATTGLTTILTNTSSFYQLFTGVLTQTVRLPVTSTLAQGWTFHICNNSTGNLTVNSSGSNLLITVLPGTTAMCTCILITGTTAASWEAGLTDFSTATGTGAVVLGTSPTIATATLTGANTIQGLTVGLGNSAVANNTAVGVSALATNSTGVGNTAIGSQTLLANDTGDYNTALGYGALTANSTNSGSNTAIGSFALLDNTAGDGNTAVGRGALQSNESFDNNTGVGYNAGFLAKGIQNSFFGYNSGYNITTGSNNVILGSYTGSAAPISATGSDWIVLSDGAGNVRGAFDSSGNFLVGTTSATTPATTSSLSVANTFGFKNRIINGAFNVGQYTSMSASGSTNCSVYVTDRWIGQGSGATCAITSTVASTTLPTSSVPQKALTVTANDASNVGLVVAQRIEAINVADLHNQTVAVQAYVATSNSATVTWTAYYANTANTWQAVGSSTAITSGATSIATGTFTTTASIALKTLTFSLGTNASANGLMFVFSCTSTATSSITITGVQLEKGAATTAFDYRPYTTELTLANRYYGLYGTVVGTSTFTNPIVPRTVMRTNPTVSAVSAAGGTGAVYSFTSYASASGFGAAYQSTAHSGSSQAVFSLNSEL